MNKGEGGEGELRRVTEGGLVDRDEFGTGAARMGEGACEPAQGAPLDGGRGHDRQAPELADALHPCEEAGRAGEDDDHGARARAQDDTCERGFEREHLARSEATEATDLPGVDGGPGEHRTHGAKEKEARVAPRSDVFKHRDAVKNEGERAGVPEAPSRSRRRGSARCARRGGRAYA